MFSLYNRLFVILVVSNFGFEGETLVRIAPVPGHCLPFTFLQSCEKLQCNLITPPFSLKHFASIEYAKCHSALPIMPKRNLKDAFKFVLFII